MRITIHTQRSLHLALVLFIWCAATGSMARPAHAQLLHRYSFDGSGTVVLDSIGTADGTVIGGAALSGTGALDFDGVDDYVELPPNMLTGLADVTLEVWFAWNGGGNWQRIFDFGDNSGGPGNQGQANSFIVLSPQDSAQGVPTGVVKVPAAASIKVYATAPAVPAAMIHYAYVYDSTGDAMSLYIDGMHQNTTVVTDDLAGVDDVNNWLGRSQYPQDPYLSGTLTELRIHAAALDATAIAGSYAAGPGGAGTPVGTSYCSPALPNSTGGPGAIRAEGSAATILGDLVLHADQLPPGRFAFFLSSQTQGTLNPPGSSGILCLAGTLAPFHHPTQIFQGPAGSLAVDLTAMPLSPPQAVLPGDTWNFQCWYRDVGNTNNLTDAVSVTFL